MPRTEQSIIRRTADRRAVRRHQAEPAERPWSRVGRAANALDRYSLFLQLIQVFPVVSAVVIIIVPRAWVARGLACFGLLLVTLWVIRIERRNNGHGRWGRRGDGDPPAAPETEQPNVVTAAVVPVQVAREEPVGRRPSGAEPVWAGVVRAEVPCDGKEITISIMLHPPSTGEDGAGAASDLP